MIKMSAKQSEDFVKDFNVINPEKLKIACVVSEWHSDITDKLFNGAVKMLKKKGYS
jgi:6,7-dimethyl-8-ribityllumazine synthase